MLEETYKIIALTKISDEQIKEGKFLDENRTISLDVNDLNEVPQRQNMDTTSSFYQLLSKQYNDDKYYIEEGWYSCCDLFDEEWDYCIEETNWNNFTKDMACLSSLNPNVLFKVKKSYIFNESNETVYTFLNGKYIEQTTIFTLTKFDLKDWQ